MIINEFGLMKNRILPLLFMLAIVFFNIMDVSAIRPGSNNILSVFLDLPGSVDSDFIRQEIHIVDYVRDRQQANVHIIMSQHTAGTAGYTYSISFIGRGAYRDKNYVLDFWAPASNTADETRRGYTEKIKSGLVPFVAQSSSAERMIIEFGDFSEAGLHIEPYDDPWDYWVFEIYGGGNFSSEETRNALHIRYGVFADRITKESKIRLRPYGNYYQRNFQTEDGGTITSTSVRGGWDSYYIKSITDHWGAGVFGDIFTSTFDNMRFNSEVSPAIEYSLFPYEEATRRSITLAWRVGLGYYDYIEETVFDKTEEFLFGQALILGADFRQPWGSVRAGVMGFHHFHDFRSNRTQLSGSLNLRVVEGLAFNIALGFNLINDQVAIPKSGLSLEEILLEQRRRATTYQFSANLGLSYTFGSRITGVFNPRLSH